MGNPFGRNGLSRLLPAPRHQKASQVIVLEGHEPDVLADRGNADLLAGEDRGSDSLSFFIVDTTAGACRPPSSRERGTRPLTASVFAPLDRSHGSQVLAAVACLARRSPVQRCDWWRGRLVGFLSGVNDHKISSIPCEWWRLPAVARPAFDRSRFA